MLALSPTLALTLALSPTLAPTLATPDGAWRLRHLLACKAAIFQAS